MVSHLQRSGFINPFQSQLIVSLNVVTLFVINDSGNSFRSEAGLWLQKFKSPGLYDNLHSWIMTLKLICHYNVKNEDWKKLAESSFGVCSVVT